MLKNINPIVGTPDFVRWRKYVHQQNQTIKAYTATQTLIDAIPEIDPQKKSIFIFVLGKLIEGMKDGFTK